MGASGVDENGAFLILAPISFIQNVSRKCLVRDYTDCLCLFYMLKITCVTSFFILYHLLRVASNFLMTGPKVNRKYSISGISLKGS